MFKLPRLSKVAKLEEKVVQGLVVAVVLLAFVMGMMWEKVRNFQNGGSSATTAATAQPAAAQPGATTVTLDQVKDAFNKAIIKIGDANDKLVFLEIADPSCPYCSIAAGHNPELNKQVGSQFTLVSDGGTYVPPVTEMRKLVDSGKAAFAYIYTPGHGNGEMGTKALYCAHEADKFWPVHDKLMTAEGYSLVNEVVKNDKTKSQAVADFLKSAMNASEMKACLDSGKYDEQLPKDVALASSLGVSGTPGFFINSTLFAGAYNWTDMQSAADAALK